MSVRAIIELELLRIKDLTVAILIVRNRVLLWQDTIWLDGEVVVKNFKAEYEYKHTAAPPVVLLI